LSETLNPPRLLFLVNDAFSPPGVLLEEAEAQGALSDVRQVHFGMGDAAMSLQPVPETAREHDGLVIMGGPMGVYEDTKFPFIEKTRALIREFHTAEKPVMGVCLGAQLVASAFGGKVWKMDGPDEFGFLPQTWERAATHDPLLHDAERGLRLFQWHHDTFELPPEAERLATREGCPNQAFRLGARTYAFQFHLELTREAIADWTVERARYRKQTPQAVANEIGPIDTALERQMQFARRVMGRWIDLVRSSRAQ